MRAHWWLCKLAVREEKHWGGGGGGGGGTEGNLSFFLSSRDSHESRISWLVLLEDVFPILGKWGNLSSDVLVCEHRFARPIRRACSQTSHVFERRTSTGSGLFALLSRDFGKSFGQIVSIRVKTFSHANLVASRRTEEPRLTTTPFIRPPRYYDHILSNQT